MPNQFSRTELLYGEEAMKALSKARIAVFGIGGVGGYVCEALVRSGVGHFDLIDKDTVSFSNINRQIIATLDTVDQNKVDIMKARMLSINPDVVVNPRAEFFLPENADSFPFESYDYVVDAIDTVTGKVEIIKRCHDLHIPVISAMGAGNKVDPTGFKVADISKTQMCPLAKVMRHELKKRGITKCKVVYSEEKPITPLIPVDEELPKGKKSIPGSNAFVPSVVGLIIASEVIKDITAPYVGWREANDR